MTGWTDAARASAAAKRKSNAHNKFVSAQTAERQLRYAVALHNDRRPKFGGVGGLGRMINWQNKGKALASQHKAAAANLDKVGKAYYKRYGG